MGITAVLLFKVCIQGSPCVDLRQADFYGPTGPDNCAILNLSINLRDVPANMLVLPSCHEPGDRRAIKAKKP